MIVDRLPAGLEIENPRLLEGAQAKQLPWLEEGRPADHVEFRDDRFVAALDLSRKGEDGADKAVSLAYMVRAVSPGTFLHPAATVEDMYRPERFARSASGRLEVKARE